VEGAELISLELEVEVLQVILCHAVAIVEPFQFFLPRIDLLVRIERRLLLLHFRFILILKYKINKSD
jgi:hypothetical protein